MGVLNMEPFWLYTSESTPAYTDENGNRHKGTTTYTKYKRCDVVPAGAANTKDFGDGVTQTYSYTVYLYDRDCRLFAIGEKVKYGRGEWLSKEFVVKGFHRYQTYCIMWI
jgi:hypothetical protein